MNNIERTDTIRAAQVANVPAPALSAPRSTARISSSLRAIASLLLAVAISTGVIWLTSHFREEIQSFGKAGLIGLFVLSILGNATLIIPAPAFMFACAAGTVFSPVGVGIVAGLGAALGELTGYLAGYGGTGIIPRGRLYQSMQAFIQRHGMLAIFLLTAIPNPIFDVGGILAGVTRMPVWQFVISAWAGKAIRLGILAFVCLSGTPWLRQLFGLQ
ncbi:MAG: YqaA family protein [Anaerolineae bacterium]